MQSSSPHPPNTSGLLPGPALAPYDSSRTRHPTTLPSPASLSVTSSAVLPPLSPLWGNGGHKSTRTSHLDDLQHQLSTKSFAHQVLLKGHDRLFSAYLRLQTRCSTLDEKSATSDTKIANLTERIRLQTELEAAEERVAEVQAARSQIQEQEEANSAQYLRIMAMSSQLQAKGAEEAKRWAAERESWVVEREDMTTRTHKLEEIAWQGGASGFQAASSADGILLASPRGPAAVMHVTPDSRLRKEITELRHKLSIEQDRARASREDGQRLAHISRELSSMSRRMAGDAPSRSNP